MTKHYQCGNPLEHVQRLIVAIMSTMLVAGAVGGQAAVAREPFERFTTASREQGPVNLGPCIVRLEDDRLLLVWCIAPRSQNTGCIVAAFSNDAGRTWSDRIELISPAPSALGDPSIVVSGSRIIVTATVPHGPDISSTTITAVRSDDNGRTWGQPYQIAMNRRYVCGKVHPGLRLKSGTLLMGYSWDTILETGATVQLESEMRTRSGAMLSNDNGLTWHNGGDFDAEYEPASRDTGRGVVEPTMVELSDGSLFMLTRTGSDHLYQARSTDEGQTWGDVGPSPLRAHNAPACLCTIEQDGQRGMLCVWDNAMVRYPLCAAVSFDSGRTWSKPKEISDPDDKNEASYPGCTQAADGTIVAVWQEPRPSSTIPQYSDIRCARFTIDWILQED